MRIFNPFLEMLATSYSVGRGLHFLTLNRLLETYTKYLSPQTLNVTPLSQEDEKLMLEEIMKTFRRDARNIAEGLYPASVLVPEDPRKYLGRLPEVLQDSVKIHWRRILNQPKSFSEEARHLAQQAPDYMQRNFHFQTDGYFSEKSAELYDTQV
jgi:hypothetical protein